MFCFSSRGRHTRGALVKGVQTSALPIKAAIEGAGGTAAIALGDLSDDASAAEVMKAAIEAFGGIDILVNNRGQYEPFAPDWTDATPEQWAATYESNVIAAVRTICASIEGERKSVV